MAFNKNFDNDYALKPTFNYVSFSGDSGTRYFNIEIWNSRVSFVFVDQTNKDSIQQIKFALSLDRIMVLHELMYQINSKRIAEYREGKPYSKIPSPVKIDGFGMKSEKDNPVQPSLVVYSREIEGSERVCIKASDATKEIEVPLYTNQLDIQVSDPDRLANIDLRDILISRFTLHLKNLPLFVSMYKLVVSGFELFTGILKRDRETGKIYNMRSSNSGYNNYGKKNIGGRADIAISSNDDLSDGDVPF